jgi:putative membrane protein
MSNANSKRDARILSGDEVDKLNQEPLNNPEQRETKRFSPDEALLVSETPTAIDTAQDEFDITEEDLGWGLSRNTKAMIFSLAVLVVGSLMLQLYDLIVDAWSRHWLIGSSFVTLAFIALVSSVSVIWNWIYSIDNFAFIKDFREQCQKAQKDKSHGQIKSEFQKLGHFYQGKPQEQLFKQAMDNLPDYADDSEIISHINAHFFQKLDIKANQIIKTNSMETGIAVATSQWAAADMLLTMWKNLKMAEKIFQVYGIKPCIKNRFKLLGLIATNMGYAGASQIISSKIAAISKGLLGNALTSVTQGLGTGLFTTHIGSITISYCRPIVIDIDERSKLNHIADELSDSLMNATKK